MRQNQNYCYFTKNCANQHLQNGDYANICPCPDWTKTYSHAVIVSQHNHDMMHVAIHVIVACVSLNRSLVIGVPLECRLLLLIL